MDADVPPPGAGVYTEMFAVPVAAISAAAMLACNWVLLTNVVARTAPFQNISEAGMNPDPFTVKVKAAVPATALMGVIDVATGTAFWICRFAGVASPPPGVGL
jgi:hypothetical protein